MDKWRPEGWKNPHSSTITIEGCKATGDVRGGFIGSTIEYEFAAFEAGADAMLEALKKRGAFLSSKELERISIHNPPRNGYLILIPEDEGMRDATFNPHEQELCDKWNAQHPVGTKVIFTDYWAKRHIGTTGEPAKVVYGKAVIWLKEPTLAARYELERIQVMELSEKKS